MLCFRFSLTNGKCLIAEADNRKNSRGLPKIDRKYLIYLDILGFEDLAKEIAQKSRISDKKVRGDFLSVIQERIEKVKNTNDIIESTYGNGDDWLLVASSIDSAFRAISRILNHSTGYKDFEKIPLEIAIGSGPCDKGAEYEGNKLVTENSTIAFLKTHILDHYREWHKRMYSSSVNSTFVVLTKSVYDDMEFYDKELCKRLESETTLTEAGNKQASFFVVDAVGIQQRGALFEFLELIGKSPDSLYRRIDRIFVPPNEYPEISNSLEKHQLIFLVGDPEIGKTYSAVRILWEYYLKGYCPIWYPGAEPQGRIEQRKKMSECNVPDNSIIYFEDPFGRHKFENRDELRREIGSFISKVQNSSAKAVLTSREEVFREFEREKLSHSDLRVFTVEMRLMKPSYTDEKRKRFCFSGQTNMTANG